MATAKRLSSITILLLVIMIPIIYLLEKIYPMIITGYLIERLKPENAVDMMEKLSYLFTEFPWGDYLILIGTMAGIAWTRRAAENVSLNLTNRNTPEDSGK